MQEKKTRGQVLWPRLVANKMLRMPLRDNSYLADFTCTGPGLHEAAKWDHVGESTSGRFQEIVPLNAKNILGGAERSTRTHMKLNKLIRVALSRSLSKSRAKVQELPAKAGEKQKVYPSKEGSSSTDYHSFEGDFRCILSKQMVGLLISVWVRSDLRQFIRHPGVSCVGCGIMGCLGNKGSVSIRFYLHETSCCFVCCHLASGGKEGDGLNRNSDVTEIISRTSFPCSPLYLPQKILHHDLVILLGDLNYRISLPESSTRSLVEQKQWQSLLEKDQLRLEVSGGGVFAGWKEGQISFSPTYKYHPNSDTYFGCNSKQAKKGEKRRAPAWCDRIIWYGEGIKQTRYQRYESWLSDHRPVRAVFTVDVEASRSMKSLRSYFLSHRFDCRKAVECSIDQFLHNPNDNDDEHRRKARSSIIHA